MNTPRDVVSYALAFLLATIAGAICTYAVRNYARRKGWVLTPATHHIHSAGIPRLGGAAIFTSFMLLFLLGAATGINPRWRDELSVVAAASLMFAVGLADDFRPLPARLKLAFEVVAGLILYFGGARLFASLAADPGGLGIFGPIISCAATVGWAVLITNALNLIDGLDGLAAGSALFSIVTLFGLALIGRNTSVVFATLVLGGSVLGFLRYNFNPATIFLGDGGSLFLGTMLGGLALQPSRAAAPTFVAIAIPVVSFGLPVVDTCVSIVRRFLRGRPLFAPDQDHIHHRLLKLGFTHKQAVIALYGFCALCALLSLFLLYPGRAVVGLVLLVAGAIVCLGVPRLAYPEFREIGRVAQRGWEQKKIISNNVAIREAARLLQQAQTGIQISNALDLILKSGEFDRYEVQTAAGFCVRRQRTHRGGIQGEVSGLKTPAWAVVVDLQTERTGRVGQFTVGRVFRRRSLLVDVNLIFSEIEPSLSLACERVIAKVPREDSGRSLETSMPHVAESVRANTIRQSEGTTFVTL